MALTYYYGGETYIKISLRLQEGTDYLSPNYVWIDYSRDIRHFLNHSQEVEEQGKEQLRQRLNELFQDECESVFIPAGRSLITLLTSQLNYLFATMDDEQKRSIDLCTQKYIERILKIRSLFENGIENLLEQKQNTPGALLDFKAIDEIRKRSKAVLKGRYVYRDGEERLYIDEQHFGRGRTANQKLQRILSSKRNNRVLRRAGRRRRFDCV